MTKYGADTMKNITSIYPGRQNEIYSYQYNKTYSGVYYNLIFSPDNGNSFHSIGNGIYGLANTLIVSPKGDLYCGTAAGLFKSTDIVDNWQPQIENFGSVSSISISPDGFVYIIKDRSIIYRSKQPIAK